MQRINKEVYRILEAALPNKTGIYPAFAIDDVRFPFVVYNCDSFAPERTKDGTYRYRMQYSVEVYSDKFDQSDNLADRVMKAFDEMESEIIRRITLTEGASVHDESFCHILKFELWVYESQ